MKRPVRMNCILTKIAMDYRLTNKNSHNQLKQFQKEKNKMNLYNIILMSGVPGQKL